MVQATRWSVVEVAVITWNIVQTCIETQDLVAKERVFDMTIQYVSYHFVNEV